MTKNWARILVLSDEVDRRYYQNWNEHTFDGIDLIIACGDLSARYLEFIATMFRGDVFYVPGNHDESYVTNPPLGCICIDNKLVKWRGLRILGLGGSMGFKNSPYQFTEQQMQKRASKLRYTIRKNKGFDILVTHAAAKGHHDGKDLCHQGFEAFNYLIQQYKPAYFFHGHLHLYYGDYPRQYQIGNTIVTNAFKSFIVDVPLPEQI